MRRRLLTAVFLLTVVGLAVAIPLPNARTLLRGLRSDGLALLLSTSKGSFVVGEPVQLQLRLENRSTQNITGDFYLSYDLDRVRILVSKDGGEFQPYLSKAIGAARLKKTGAEPVTIAPGDAVESSELVSFDIKRDDFALYAAGSYRLQAVLLAEFYEQPALSSCLGDCGFDGSVTVDELIRGVNIALGQAAISDCPTFDGSGDGSVTIDELVRAVNAALTGCG